MANYLVDGINFFNKVFTSMDHRLLRKQTARRVCGGPSVYLFYICSADVRDYLMPSLPLTAAVTSTTFGP